MTTSPTEAACVACHRSKQETPLIRLEYGEGQYWICPQHLPLLIHDPGRLVGLLPGAEHLAPAEHHD
jgi:hypothetical protein